ncbi:hypothetical protein N7481_001511 [Penicillium waksmanii]|uniref:uncharacterized protein n=1 Tax=Penicillium waksmanii TaxID=69791 RepID=UPI002546F42B|nr:uncharacterized protein N7481_001511 [Penicillium waksmanii]KAJ6001102.1 hypothetical protein N7481_001511 [Penicillium waksmanii]
MFLRAVGLLSLTLLHLVNSISFSSPPPTPTPTLPNRSRQDAPQPTPSADLQHWGIMRRDDDLFISSHRWPDSLCGWQNTSVVTESQVKCSTSSTCVYYASNTIWPGIVNCCPGLDCVPWTTCYGADEISKLPDLTKTSGGFALLCTRLHNEVCVTWNYPDLDARHYGCRTTSNSWDVFNFALEFTDTVTVRYDHSLITADDNMVSSYAASFSSFSISQTGDSGLTTSSESFDATQISKPSSSSSDRSTSTTPTGAIVGGVIGGVAGGAVIALAGVFLYLRRKKGKDQTKAGVSSEYSGGPSQSLPGNRPIYLSAGMQKPSEIDSRESPYQISEVWGTAPADRAHEMQGDTNPMLEADSKHVLHSKDIAAELPAESRRVAGP